MQSNNYFLNTYKKSSSKNNVAKNFQSDENESKSDNANDKRNIQNIVFEKLEKNETAVKRDFDDKSNNSPVSKKRLAAIFLILVGFNKAKEIVKSFSEDELIKIINEIIKIDVISDDEIKEVEKNFGKIGNKSTDLKGGKEYARILLQNSFGIAKGSDIFVKSVESKEQAGFDFLNEFVPEKIRDIVVEESDTIIALILGMIDAKKSANVISLLPKDRIAGIIKKIYSKIEINSDILEIIINKIKERAESLKNDEENTIMISGKNKLLHILKNTSNSQSEIILTALEKDNPQLAVELKENIFTFSDVINIRKKDFEFALKDYPDKEIAFILKGAKDEIKTIFFTCITKRRKEIIEDEIVVLDKVLKSEVDERRKIFISYLKNLEAKGKISLTPDNDIYIS